MSCVISVCTIVAARYACTPDKSDSNAHDFSERLCRVAGGILPLVGSGDLAAPLACAQFPAYGRFLRDRYVKVIIAVRRTHDVPPNRTNKITLKRRGDALVHDILELSDEESLAEFVEGGGPHKDDDDYARHEDDGYRTLLFSTESVICGAIGLPIPTHRE